MSKAFSQGAAEGLDEWFFLISIKEVKVKPEIYVSAFKPELKLLMTRTNGIGQETLY